MKKRSTAELDRPSTATFREMDKFPLVVVLDNVRSALNVGSVFRTADAFACSGICLCGITATPPHREILKTALGSTESVSWRSFPTTLDAVLHLKSAGFLILAAEQAQPSVWLQEFLPAPATQYALVLGNEVDGVSNEVLELCDAVLEIPQYGTKHSLNIAVAAGVAIWEITKKMKPLER